MMGWPCNLILVLSTSLFVGTLSDIIISYKEEQCLEQTAKVYEEADKDLLIARHDFSTSMDMDMTSRQKMYAKYPQEKLDRYDATCTKYGGKLHTIKLDFFDCKLNGSSDDIELTLKNFANCMADVEDCEGFGQEHLLQEAWDELGLHCALEDEETKKDPINPPPPKIFNDDDAIAKKEKEAAAKGADDVNKEEKNAEYVPKEQQNSSSSSDKKKKKKKGGFMKFVLFVSVCGVGYFVYGRHRQGLPIQLPGGRLLHIPTFGAGSGVPPSRFQGGLPPQTVSNYNLLSGEEEINYNINNNELQLSSNLTA